MQLHLTDREIWMSFKNGISIEAWNDWAGVLMPWTVNWVDFCFIAFSAEYEKLFGNAQLHFALLGLHFRLTIKVSNGDVEAQEEINSRFEKFMDEES